MAMIHEFLLLEESGDCREQYRAHINDPNAVRVHDDVLEYMRDSLMWIPSRNPANPNEWPGRGLNWYGPTTIDGPGARTASRVFSAWATLFDCGPETLELTGEFGWIEGKSPPNGEYQQVRAPRDELVAKLRDLAKLSQRAAEPGRWLLHLGI